MKLAKRILYNLGKLYPKKYRKAITDLLKYTNQKENTYLYLGKGALFSILLSLIAMLITSIFTKNLLLKIIISITFFVIMQSILYLLIFLKADNIKNRIEKSLPDALQLISSNLEAGATPFQAIRAATRSEFGELGKMFDRATKKTLASESFTSSLMEITKNTNSEIFKRAIKLIISSLRTGGHLGNVLKELAEDIAERRQLKEEMLTNTKTYIMFIMFTIVIGAPLLLAISIHFVTIVNNLQESVNISSSQFGLGFLAGGIQITPEFLTKISYIMLFFISILASMLMGVIREGKAKVGIKYSPFIIGGAYLMFIIAQRVVENMFGGVL